MDQKLSAHSLQHFYVALGTAAVKMDSLIELITALECTGPLSFVICCGSRDVLDAVAAMLHTLDRISLWCLHADMSEREIDSEVQSFRRSVSAMTKPKTSPREEEQPDAAGGILQPIPGAEENFIPAAAGGGGSGHRRSREDGKVTSTPTFRALCALITTDSPLRAVNKDLLPLAPTLLINYDIPVRKEDYVKRIGAVLGGRARAEGQRLCVNFLEAGRVGELRQLEEFAEREVKEMPVHVADVFQKGADR